MPSQPQITIVTGANRGIGLEAARQLARRPDQQIIFTARDADKGQAALAGLDTPHSNLSFHVLDVNDWKSIARLIGYAKQQYGRIDALINNAAVYLDEDQLLHQIDPELFTQTLQTNLIGPYQMARAVIPTMIKQNYGRIVNVSSGYGAFASMTPGVGAYKVSKLALNGLTKILAAEVEAYNIKINAISPGWVRTDMGGPNAERSVKDGAQGLIWAATLDADGPNGGFFRDDQPIPF